MTDSGIAARWALLLACTLALLAPGFASAEKADRDKPRVAFYYLLAEKYDKLSLFSS